MYPYNAELANAWWRILLSSQQVMQIYRARFTGKTPPIGLMWGTFDLRDARYNGVSVESTYQAGAELAGCDPKLISTGKAT